MRPSLSVGWSSALSQIAWPWDKTATDHRGQQVPEQGGEGPRGWPLVTVVRPHPWKPGFSSVLFLLFPLSFFALSPSSPLKKHFHPWNMWSRFRSTEKQTPCETDVSLFNQGVVWSSVALLEVSELLKWDTVPCIRWGGNIKSYTHHKVRREHVPLEPKENVLLQSYCLQGTEV